jgi:steroid 5-alpha reductase family enzyme
MGLLLFKMWALSALIMTGVWGLVLQYKTPSLIDAYWPIGILILSLWLNVDTLTTISSNQDLFRLIQVSLVVCWAMRLSGYILWTRVKKGHQDPRYLALSQTWPSMRLGYLKNMQIQAVLQVGVASVFLHVSASIMGFNPIACIIGILIAVLGCTIECVADWQLSQFKKRQVEIKTKTLCTTGLWSLSHHPNYVGEWIFWVGISLISWGISVSIIYWISPVLMYIILVHITGPITEKESLKRKKAEFERYQETTAYFLPNPKLIWSKIKRRINQ